MRRRRICRAPKFHVAGMYARMEAHYRPDVPEWISALDSRLYPL